MAQCVKVISSTQLELVPASPATCEGYLLLTPEEFGRTQFYVPLSLEDGVLISMAIIGLWALAFVYRVLGRYINSGNGE